MRVLPCYEGYNEEALHKDLLCKEIMNLRKELIEVHTMLTVKLNLNDSEDKKTVKEYLDKYWPKT